MMLLLPSSFLDASSFDETAAAVVLSGVVAGVSTVVVLEDGFWVVRQVSEIISPGRRFSVLIDCHNLPRNT
jgi:hypothetical protein